MAVMRNDNHLLPAATNAVRNIERLARYRERFMAIHGRWPECRHAERHSNATVIKFPRRRGQYQGAQLPGPDAA